MKYHGVSYHSGRGHAKWRVKFKTHGTHYNFGEYDDPERAARIRDALIMRLKGPHEPMNFDGKPPADMTLAEIDTMLRRHGLL